MRFSDRSSDVARPIPVLQPDLADVGLPLTPGTLVKRAVLIEKPFGKGAPVMWVGGDHPITLRGNRCGAQKGDQQKQQRSEEHTSELQSLMRISYAVFCLKKKNQVEQTNTTRLNLSCIIPDNSKQ